MLVLFDIDGTLVATEGAGRAAMQAAGRELFGPAFTCDGVRFSGKLDPGLWREIGAANRVADAAAHDARFREAYARHLELVS